MHAECYNVQGNRVKCVVDRPDVAYRRWWSPWCGKQRLDWYLEGFLEVSKSLQEAAEHIEHGAATGKKDKNEKLTAKEDKDIFRYLYRPVCFYVSKEWFMRLCTYLFVLESLHQLWYPTEGHGEGQVGATVAIGHLNALVTKVPLPFCVPADFILTKDVRY